MNKKEQQARVAAKWWAKQLEAPNFDAGADSIQMLAVQMMAKTSHERPSEIILDAFEEALRQIILAESPRVVSVDYDPDITLVRAAKEAGLYIGANTFPWKTVMWLDKNGSIQVKEGYGAETRIILEPYVYREEHEIVEDICSPVRKFRKTARTTFIRLNRPVKCGSPGNVCMNYTPGDALALYKDGAWAVAPENLEATYELIEPLPKGPTNGYLVLNVPEDVTEVTCYADAVLIWGSAVEVASFTGVKTAVTEAVQAPYDVWIQSKEDVSPVLVSKGDWVVFSGDGTIYHFTDQYLQENYQEIE